MGKFRTTEISDSVFESANLRFITVKSNNLKGRGDIAVYVPPGQRLENLPVVILLHGVYGSAWIWPFKGGAHITTHKLISSNLITPMIIAMPSDGLWGDGSAYLPHHSLNFENWIVQDVREAIVELIPQASEQSDFFISGLSMGGFGAMRLGAKHHQLFKGISAHSAITDLEQMSKFVEEPLSLYRQSTQLDQNVLATVVANRENLPPLRFDCGTEDLLIQENMALHLGLQNANIPHEYAEFAGAHEWEYWIEHLKDSLLFFNNITLTKN